MQPQHVIECKEDQTIHRARSLLFSKALEHPAKPLFNLIGGNAETLLDFLLTHWLKNDIAPFGRELSRRFVDVQHVENRAVDDDG